MRLDCDGFAIPVARRILMSNHPTLHVLAREVQIQLAKIKAAGSRPSVCPFACSLTLRGIPIGVWSEATTFDGVWATGGQS
jgi:hypothetical protein